MSGMVLLVEDEPGLRESMRELLEHAGFEVHTAPGGQEALSMLSRLATSSPCLLVVDLMMPEVSGWDLIQAMRADARFARVPVIIVSGVGKMLAQTPGVVAVLQKPIDADQLVDTVSRYCRAS